MQAGKQTGRKANRQKGRQAERQTGKQASNPPNSPSAILRFVHLRDGAVESGEVPEFVQAAIVSAMIRKRLVGQPVRIVVQVETTAKRNRKRNLSQASRS